MNVLPVNRSPPFWATTRSARLDAGGFIVGTGALKTPWMFGELLHPLAATVEFGDCETSILSALLLFERPNVGLLHTSRLSLECSGPLTWSVGANWISLQEKPLGMPARGRDLRNSPPQYLSAFCCCVVVAYAA